MKVTRIEHKDNIFYVIYEHTTFQKLLGKKKIVDEYKELIDKKYTNYPDKGVYIDKNGSLIGGDSGMTKILDDSKRGW